MNKAQQQQYYELLRELVMYANERLGVVRDFDVYRSSPATDSKLEEDGNEIRPGEADPCPWGLGRSYGECCGRRYRRAGDAPRGRGRSSE